MRNGKRAKLTVREEPLDMLWPREIDRFFERGFGLGPWAPWLPTRRWRRAWLPEEWMPDIDVFEREGKLVVRADLPGVKREDVELRVQDEKLILRGQREEKEEVTEKDYHHCERQTGAFTRIVNLPEGIKPNAIEATFTDGVLEVVVPKPAASELKPVPIPVK